MFADLHYLHHLTCLEQGGSVSITSTVSGTSAGNADIYFGAAHLDNTNVAESWLSDDQVSDMSVGGNGPVDRNEGMYNAYTSIKAYWSDTIFMDNLRGGDATGLATPGAQEVTAANPGNTIHTISSDTFYTD